MKRLAVIDLIARNGEVYSKRRRSLLGIYFDSLKEREMSHLHF